MLNRIIKNLLLYTIPIRYKLDKVLYNSTKTNESLLKWDSCLKNEPLIIVGNGPSLNKTPLEEFSGVKSIGMNKINLLFPTTKWRPDYIFCINNLVAKQNKSFFETSTIPCFLSWKNRWFVDRSKNKNLQYFLNNSNSTFSKDFLNGIGSAGTVTYSALQFAYFTKANPIILFGVDHNFSYKGNPNEISTSEGDDVNHFVPNYFAVGEKWGIPNLEKSEVGYSNSKQAFQDAGVEIFDATVDGKLEVFKKISVNEAKRICGI